MHRQLTALVLLTASLGGPVANAQAAPAPDPEPVLSAAARSLGVRNLSRLPSIHVTATGTEAGLPARVEAYTDLAGGTFAAYARLGTFTQDGGYDGKSAWTRDSGGVVWVDGSQQGHASAVNEAFRESYALWMPGHGGASVSLAPPQSDAGQTYDVVRVTAPGSVVPFDVWIDRATHLPARYVETAAAVTTTTKLSDYRPVAGVQIAFANDQKSDQGNAAVLHASQVEIAPADLAAKVRKPDSSPHDFSIAESNEASVPFELIDNHVYLDVMLNGKGPYRFVFDTGGANVIDPAVAREIGAVPAGNVQGGGVGAATETVAFAPVASLHVGGAELRDQLFAVLPIRAGFGVGGSAPVDGLIGAEVLARFVTVFDYERSRVTFKLPGAPSEGQSIPFVFDGTQPEIPCAVDHIAGNCTIDTGSRSSIDLFGPFVAANPAVVPAGVTAPGVNGFGVGGADVGRLGRLSSLQMGSYDIANLVAGFSAATSGAFAVPGVAANIGGGVLKRFTVTFDYQHQTMSLVPDAAFASRDDFERSGLFLIHRDKIVVASVRPGTPAAAAGIARGDAIEAVDDLSGDGLTLGSARKALQRPAGTTVKLRVSSPGAAAPRTVTLVLRDYV
jgi:hypothetical protein